MESAVQCVMGRSRTSHVHSKIRQETYLKGNFSVYRILQIALSFAGVGVRIGF